MLSKDELLKQTEKLKISDLSEFPSLNLYMDQVLELLSRDPIFLAKEEKLTAAMVNNYIKEGLLPRAKGKKYSIKHVALLTMISRLKQVISVKEISSLNKLLDTDNSDETFNKVYDEFESVLKKEIDRMKEKIHNIDLENEEYLILDLAISSYVDKVMCQLVLKEVTEEKLKEKKEEKTKMKEVAKAKKKK